MTGNERREQIIRILQASSSPLSGKTLAEALHVSRQVIVQDIALLRAQEHTILSTNSGYLLKKAEQARRVFKVSHGDSQVEDELNLFVDYGGVVEDVFIYHKVYGTVRAELNIRNRKDVQNFLADLQAGRSGLLKNVTDSYHYHTVSAPTETLLELIQTKLEESGYLAPLQDYEPVNFREQATS